MEREHLTRNDFPRAHGSEGFDVDTVGAHLAAVATHVAALEARIASLEIERDTLRRQLADARATEPGPSGLPVQGPDPLENLPGLDPEEPESEPAAKQASDPVAEQGPTAAPGEDEVAARLLASRLATGGTSRDTIVMQVAAAHEVASPGALVDDVLAKLS